MIAELVRHSHGRLADRIAARANCTSIIVAAELRYGAVRKVSVRLAAELEGVLRAIDVLALETPVDSVYGELRARLERACQSIGATICSFPLTP
jgi:tRNA(fMet)-specific endonuclease VapC